jgi:hypothetical protein
LLPVARGAAPVNPTNKGNDTMNTQTSVASKTMTDLTCWKCGEESLKELFVAVDPNAFRSAVTTVAATMQSECTKCGVHSVNATQALQNKISARKSRKAFIKIANSKSS